MAGRFRTLRNEWARLPRLSRPAWLAITAAWVGGVTLIAWWTVA